MLGLIRFALTTLSLVVFCGGVFFVSTGAEAFYSKKKKPKEVKVINGPEMPVPVVVQPERKPYRQVVRPLGSGDQTFICLFDVPSDYRLIIEVLSIQAQGSNIRSSQLQTQLFDEPSVIEAIVIGLTNFGSNDESSMTAHGPYYADATNAFDDDADIRWAVLTNQDNASLALCSLSGQLIPAPNT